MQPLKIGFITDNLAQSQLLKEVVDDCGHMAAVTLPLTEALLDEVLSLPCSIDAWLVKIDVDDGSEDWLDSWLEATTEPVIFIDECPARTDEEYARWSRRLSNKIQRLSGAINLEKEQQLDAFAKRIRSIWVLAASTGGPEAVKIFLSNLPAQLDIAFIYVQHIDSKFEKTLSEVMGRDSHYPVYAAEHGALVQTNAVAVIGADMCTELHENGTFTNKRQPWSGHYSPSADQVAANLARTFGARANVIIFSGMESDGAIACRLIKQKGGRVWVQSPASCISPSMPEAALATGCVDYQGSAEGLARHLTQEISAGDNSVALLKKTHN